MSEEHTKELERETICGNCRNLLYQNANPNNIHWYHVGTGDVRCPTTFAEPISRASVAAPQPPMCAVHAALDRKDTLVLEVGNGCVACSLHERTALLNLLEPFAAEDGSQDSLTVLRGIIASAAPPSTQPSAPAAPSDVDHLLFRLAAKDCEHLAAGMNDCTEELAIADWCAVCTARSLIQKYSRAAATADNDGERCKRSPWPCRYPNARQCAHDTMLGDDCPKVCDCACHTESSAAAG